MGIISGLGSVFRVMADAIDPKRDAYDPRFWADSGNVSVAGVTVTEPKVSQLGAVQAVRFGLSASLSSLPFMVFKEERDGTHTEAKDHELFKLMQRPDDRNSFAVFIGELAWHLSYWRNAYCEIVPGSDYAIGALKIIHPRRFVKVEERDGHLHYEFKPLTGTTGNLKLRDDQVWHLRGNPLREDGLTGEGIWESAREVFGRAIAVHEYGDIWFKNSGQTGGTLEHPGMFKDKEEQQRFLDAWRAGGSGPNRHRDKLLTHGVKYNPLKVTNAEAQLLETENRSDTEVFGLWSFPPHRAGRLERSTNNNIEQQSLDFVIYSLAPLGIAIQQAMKHDLIVGDGAEQFFVEFNYEPLLRGDLRSQYQALLMARQGEWMSANDVLRYLGRNPRQDAAGDEYQNPMTKDSSGGTDGGPDNSTDAPGDGSKPAKPGD